MGLRLYCLNEADNFASVLKEDCQYEYYESLR